MRYGLFILLAALSLFPKLAQAEQIEGIKLAYTASSCGHGVTLLYYSHSTHPGGNPYRALNENNSGIGFRCQHSKDSSIYYTVSGLKNSQFGDTFVAGPGMSWTILSFSPMRSFGVISVEAGAELPFVYYESPRHRQYVYGLLPVATVGLKLTLPRNWGTIGYVQNHLADTGVKLYAIQYSYKF